MLLWGVLALTSSLPMPRVLLLAAATGAVGAAAAYLGGRPEALADGPAVAPLALLFVADASRICAAALALARHINSVGVALLIVAVATAADLFSVFAGPTKAFVREGSPALDFLLVVFPTFGHPLGFALGVADFVFLALGCVAALAAMLAGLLLQTYLPALPFIDRPFFYPGKRRPRPQAPPESERIKLVPGPTPYVGVTSVNVY